MILIEDMEEVEVTFEVDLIITLVECGRTEGHGDNLDQEKEKGELGHHPSSRLGLRTSMNRDRIRCFKCREYDHFANECLNLVPEDSDRESNGASSISLHLGRQ